LFPEVNFLGGVKMENLKADVLSGFEITPKSIIKSKHSYICKTGKGMRVIQKTNAEESSLLAAHKIKGILEEKGYPIYDKFYVSTQNLPYFSLDGEKYIMTDFKDFTEADFSKADDVKNIIRAVARFHKLSKNIQLSLSKNNDVLKNYRKSLANFKSVKKSISSKGSFSEFDVLFIKNYDYFLRRASDALSILNEVAGEDLSENEFFAVCHNNIKEETAVRYKNNMSLISFENMAFGLFVSDFSDIINRYIRKHTPPALSFDEIMDAYLKINSLSDNNIRLLLAILRFPSKYIKICCDFYSKGMPFVPNSVVNHLKSIISRKSVYEEYTRDF